MHDYYAHHPTVILDRPVCLVGFMGAEVAQVGYGLCSRTGLPYVEIDRKVEHAAGTRRAQVALHQGMAALRRLERQALDQALAARPAGVLVLNDASLIDAGVRRRVLERADLVYIRRPRKVLLANIQARLAQTPTRWPEFLEGAPADEAALEPLLRAREAGYEAAPHLVEAGTLHPQQVAQRLMARLGW